MTRHTVRKKCVDCGTPLPRRALRGEALEDSKAKNASRCTVCLARRRHDGRKERREARAKPWQGKL